MTREVTKKIIYQIPEGLSVENSVLIAKIANRSNSRVTIECKGNVYTAHSILKLLSMDIGGDDLVMISACGKDAEETVSNICTLLVENVARYIHSDSGQASLV